VDLIGGLGPDGGARFKYIGQPPHFQNGWNLFESIDPEQVVRLVQTSPFFLDQRPDLPSVYINVINPRLESVKSAHYILFRTHGGEVGVMKVLGENQNPRGVKIRYKLVQRSLTTSTPVNLPTPRRELAFGRVMERVIQARQSGTNMFLDLDSGKILTPAPAAIEALNTGNSSNDVENYWQGLDIMANTRPARYLAWLNESGADLMFNGKEDVLTFDGILTAAHGTNSALLDSWDGLTPDMARSAADQIEKATRNVNSGVTIVGSYTSAKQLHSRYGGPRVNQLTPDQSRMWFFKTREGGVGILQITGFTENPRSMKLRYKLAQNAR
jgi:hypothetical protein